MANKPNRKRRNNARKEAARDAQRRNPGLSYRKALEQVSSKETAPLATKGLAAVPIGVDGTGEAVLVDFTAHGMILADLCTGFCPPANTGHFLRQLLSAAAAAADPREQQIWIVRPGYMSDDQIRPPEAPMRELRPIEPSEVILDTAIHALPHVTQVLTGTYTQVKDRFTSLISAEMARREAQLTAANVPDLATYNETRRWDPSLGAIPRLLVHIDYLQGLSSGVRLDEPGLRLLNAIARSGRSLGIQLQVATHELDCTADSLSGFMSYRVLLETENRPHSTRWWFRTTDEEHPWIRKSGRGLLKTASAPRLFSFSAAPS
ncbi:hypothetical protein [Mycobacterium avium]|uniref:Uncharacterized protein n=1 Tax=Mycobacterium avium subsp. hominissuis TaxID=439334 RepID=A0AAI8ST30_MYCAV|nr:hypothetical protein [Mycobacterium avium]BBN50751.1 hypothetical protein JPH1_52260 [Mycobacterium avium subsp. hominissuis]